MNENNNEIKNYNVPGRYYTMARDFAANAAAGLAVSSTLFPLESAKKLMQRGEELKLSKREIFRQLFKTGKVGDYVAYRGFSVFALNIVPTTFIQLTAEKNLAEYIPDDAPAPLLAVRAIACGILGAITATVVENTITRQQVTKANFIPALKDMWAISPLRLFKTFPLIAVRDSIFTLNLFFINPVIQKYLKENYSDNNVLSSKYFSAFLSTLIGATASHSFDTVATKLQESHGKSNYVETFNQLINSKNEKTNLRNGYSALFRGFSFRLPLFYGFIMMIPSARKECTDYIDREFNVTSTSKLNNQSFFVRPAAERVLESKSDHKALPKP